MRTSLTAMGKHSKHHWQGTFAILIALNGMRTVHAQCLRFTVDTVHGPQCQSVGSASFAFGVNAIGDLCGGYTPCGEGVSGAAVWLGRGDWQEIPDAPVGLFSRVDDINTAQQIAATYRLPNPQPLYRAAFIDSPTGSVTTLALPPGFGESEAHAIAENSSICGYVSGSNLRAYEWHGGDILLLDLPIGPNSVGHDISDEGSICGWMGNSLSNSHAFVWRRESVIDLGVIPSGQSAVAYGISANGSRVCGAGVLPQFDGGPLTLHAFYWSKGNMIDLGTLPGQPRSRATSLNDSGVVVGNSYNENLVGEAFVWQNGTMHALNDLIPQELNLHVDIAYAINYSGQIAATGMLENGDTVALRLNPVPPQPGDCTCDWLVNSEDLMAVIRTWGECPPQPRDPTQAPPFAPPLCSTDLNNDGRVNVPDLLMVINHWSP